MATVTAIVHLSDIHFRAGWHEELGLVLSRFFEDLDRQLGSVPRDRRFAAISGDLVLAGGNRDLYEQFFERFDQGLTACGIAKANRILVPGNHDISVGSVEAAFTAHEAIVAQGLSESSFNDYVERADCAFLDKFANYLAFEPRFGERGVASSSWTGKGHSIGGGIGVYCLNTAVCASGGVRGVVDKQRLAFDSRALHRWLSASTDKVKVLVMHHPREHLVEWASVELERALRNHFSLCLSGHVHSQNCIHQVTGGGSLLECTAPALFSRKSDKLGYSISLLDNHGIIEVQYRQWTQRQKFVTGVDFSDSDDGRLVVREKHDSTTDDPIATTLSGRLDEALRSFSGQPIIWAEPVLSKSNDFAHNMGNPAQVETPIDELTSNPKSWIIKAPPQFGLTCLSHYLVKAAWSKHGARWLYLDAPDLRAGAVEKCIRNELASVGLRRDQVACVVLDSWRLSAPNSIKQLAKVSEEFKDLPILVMQTIDDSEFAASQSSDGVTREFEVLFLLALGRSHIRGIVNDYNTKKYIGDENAIVNKVVSDLEILNIHRTPMNCITLLKVCEKHFDESPINRTKMLETVLSLLFDGGTIPEYKSRPDVKDCEYVLGRYCELMLRNEKYRFSRHEFMAEIRGFCSERLMDLEVDIVFDILHENNIIIMRDGDYSFRFSYWVFYFAARRMHSHPEFAKYIFDDRRYVSFPELVEFYTGIDRCRSDALEIVLRDLHDACDIVQSKVGIPDTLNPYRYAAWNPTEQSIDRMKSEIGEDVAKSKLPDDVKDRHADAPYNPAKPYDQTIRSILSHFSVAILMSNIKAASRALRNSDYVEPQLKKRLLSEILRGWEQLAKVLLALSPLLAVHKQAAYEGVAFMLLGDFGASPEARLPQIWAALPSGIVRMYKDDLYSPKMGPLLFEHLSDETNELKRHKVVLLLIAERPRDWKRHVEAYIVANAKNSFYLASVVDELLSEYQFSFASDPVRREIAFLIKKGLAKHQFGDKNPGLDKVVKIPNSVLPKPAAHVAAGGRDESK